jgi:hypothetical protein
MADSSGWITIKQMTNEILFETGHDMGMYKKFMHHIINGVREINKFHYDNVKTEKVTCNSLGYINLPSDYVNFVAISMNYGGLMYPLTRQDGLVRTTTLENGAETQDSDIGEGVGLDKGSNRRYATLGAKNDYYYTIIGRDNTILVNETPTRTFFLQYISSGIDLDDGNDTQIPKKIKEALKQYVMYKNILMDKSSDKRLIPIYKQEYNEEVSKLKFLELPTGSELLDIIYGTYSEIRR